MSIDILSYFSISYILTIEEIKYFCVFVQKSTQKAPAITGALSIKHTRILYIPQRMEQGILFPYP